MQLDYKYDDYCTQNASQIWNLFPSNISWALLEKKAWLIEKLAVTNLKAWVRTRKQSKSEERKEISVTEVQCSNAKVAVNYFSTLN